MHNRNICPIILQMSILNIAQINQLHALYVWSESFTNYCHWTSEPIHVLHISKIILFTPSCCPTTYILLNPLTNFFKLKSANSWWLIGRFDALRLKGYKFESC